MAPNSEEDFQSQGSWGTEFFEKEPLRPPVYNPEDYATYLKKWGRKTNSGMQLPLYLSQSTGSINKLSADLSFNDKSQSSGSAKSSSLKSSDEKQSKKDFTLKMEKKDLKNKENIHRGLKTDLNVDFRNPILALSPQKGEMSLRQFSSVTELLGKLKVDLKLSFPSFVQEFVGDPVDGVTLLLELLRAVQLSQASQQQRRPPQIFRRALLDEHSCLVCLKHCLRCSDATRRLVSSTAGLFTLAVCIMSNVTQSRIIALELLTKACEIPENGHKAVSEALSTLRLRFGEPVRFRFLVGMLNSAGTIELLASAMKFINVFVETVPNIQQKVYIQAELEQAGFDAKTLRKTLPCNSESVKAELSKWEKHYFDVEILQNKLVEVNTLHEKINLLEKRIEILQEEKGILQSLEQCLKERCSELEEEMSSKTTTTATPKTPTKQFHNYNSHQGKRNVEKGESTPAEDEGISSSEQELSQDEDYIKGGLLYNNSNDFGQKGNPNESRRGLHCIKDSGKPSNTCTAKNFKNIRSSKMKETNVDDGSEIIRMEGESNEEEETTIDEVIEELENIVNDAETAVYANEKTGYSNENMKSGISVKIKSENKPEERNRTYSKSVEKEIFEETEIVPSLLHPQPPRKAKSLVHIYLPRRDFDSHDHTKSEFFDDDTDTESSDSLLTATREKKMLNKFSHKSLDVTDSFGSFSSTNTRTLFIKQEDDYNNSDIHMNLGYEERNIDEEEVKRKHLKNSHSFKVENRRTENVSPIFFKDTKFVENAKKTFQRDFVGERLMRESAEKLNEKRFNIVYEKTTSFQGVKSCQNVKLFGEEQFSRRTQKCPPVPVKRSQTFHITTSDADILYKRNEIKPKPKMGVRGLDFQRSTEQKVKNDQGKYQSIEYKKNLERKSDANDRYAKRAFKDVQKNQTEENNISTNRNQLLRRGSFNGVFTSVETKIKCEKQIDVPEKPISRFSNESFGGPDRSGAKIRSKSLEKMDEGLDSLVDIVIATDETKKSKPKTESNLEVTKNIGPRTRRSLAESSLFSPPRERVSAKVEEPEKPPKPAQRTSLARHNSSSTPLNLPREIKLAPVQPNPRQQIVYNFGVKSAKSEDSLYSAIKRYSPDGCSSPNENKANNHNNSELSDSTTAIYSIPIKQSKLKNYFENNNGDANSNQNFFKNDDSRATVTSDKPVTSTLRNVQSMTGNVNQKVQNFISNSNQSAKSNDFKSVPPKSNSSKPNFLLGTYQSQAVKNIPKPSSSVIHSINTFNNSFLVKKSNENANGYTGKRFNGSGCNGSSQNGRNLDNCNRKSKAENASSSEKLTDSPSGLY